MLVSRHRKNLPSFQIEAAKQELRAVSIENTLLKKNSKVLADKLRQIERKNIRHRVLHGINTPEAVSRSRTINNDQKTEPFELTYNLNDSICTCGQTQKDAKEIIFQLEKNVTNLMEQVHELSKERDEALKQKTQMVENIEKAVSMEVRRQKEAVEKEVDNSFSIATNEKNNKEETLQIRLQIVQAKLNALQVRATAEREIQDKTIAVLDEQRNEIRRLKFSLLVCKNVHAKK